MVRHRIDIVPIDRIQSARSSSSPFQRRAGLVTLHVDVASPSVGAVLLPGLGAGSPDLFDMDADTARDLRSELPRRSAPR